ncbi:MAG: dephospho-CoA kinase [Hyphomicrobiaceae bacterium]|nr:dephospho-CoA kinase [Hyphomicrobiaceae bacterium]
MVVIGFTGSIGMGKSTIADRFLALGVPVCDADAIVHRLYEGEAAAAIEAAFPGTTSAGKVDRVKLGQAVLGDAHGLKRLESIVHPLVQAAEREFLRKSFEQGATMAVLEIPLLFETGGDARVDVTVVVSAPAKVQRERVLQRPRMTQSKLDAILNRQMPDAEKRRRADFVVDTGGSIEESHARIDAIVEVLRNRGGRAYQQFWS